MSLEQLVNSRSSVRAFKSDSVSKELLTKILETAARAPSGSNIQPWQVYVLQGEKRDNLIKEVCKVHDALALNPELAKEYPPSYQYYPTHWMSPYLERRRENGWGLYSLLGIQRGEKQKMHAQHQRNLEFFGAPVGLIFTIHKELGTGLLIDYGMFLQTLMLAAQANGLATCPQGAWVSYAKVVMPLIGAGPDELLVCGMSLGYEDKQAVVNSFRPPREKVESFTRWV